MRIIHIHIPLDLVKIGVTACIPLNASFPAHFTEFALGECQWELYVNPEG
jgi:uncharacterized protein